MAKTSRRKSAAKDETLNQAVDSSAETLAINLEQQDRSCNLSSQAQDMAATPSIPPAYRSLTIDELRQRLKQAAAKSGLENAEIGLRMGIESAKDAKNKVWWLLNRSPDPGVLAIAKFCHAINVRMDDLFKT